MARIIDGKAIATKIRMEIAAEVEILKSNKGITPGLAVVLVGNDPASHTYVNSKEKACKEVGMYSEVIRMAEDTTEEELLNIINSLNNRKEINGILVQLPLPKHIDEKKVIDSISPEKDVDGFHPVNAGNLLIGTAKLVPCTPRGVIELLDEEKIEIDGKKAVVIGRSNIVGKPVALLLMQRNATVTVCHSRTKNLDAITSQADILVVGIGRPKMIKASMVKEGAVVIDVGINRVDGKLVGDVDYDDVFAKCSAITPVPGGVGPMTIAMLLRNTLIAAQG